MHIIGIDYLSITPASKKGNNGLYVVRNLSTKLTDIYPATSHDAVQAATSIYQYITTYGIFECIISDPGSDFTSKLDSELNKLLGIQHYISIVDRHESNGVERVNKEIIRQR
jgi:chromatin remodeling complex protein RSC6